MLGTAVVPALERAGHKVLATDKAEADVTRLESLDPIANYRPDWILHLAAFTNVDDCESKVDEAYAVNAIGSRNVAICSVACGASLLAISTDYVFDGSSTRPYREYDRPGPLSVYGASKWAGEQAVRDIQPRHLIVRTAWLYGVGGANFIDAILRKARAGETLRVVDDQHGSPTSTTDLAEGMLRLVTSGQLGTFHCVNAGEASRYDQAAHALARAGIKARLERADTASMPRPAKRPAYSVLDTSWFEAVTGTRLPPWRHAVDRYLEAATAAPRGGA
jgi:dTDP-4-dehydrorhamnose reductase